MFLEPIHILCPYIYICKFVCFVYIAQHSIVVCAFCPIVSNAVWHWNCRTKWFIPLLTLSLSLSWLLFGERYALKVNAEENIDGEIEGGIENFGNFDRIGSLNHRIHMRSKGYTFIWFGVKQIHIYDRQHTVRFEWMRFRMVSHKFILELWKPLKPSSCLCVCVF